VDEDYPAGCEINEPLPERTVSKLELTSLS